MRTLFLSLPLSLLVLLLAVPAVVSADEDESETVEEEVVFEGDTLEEEVDFGDEEDGETLVEEIGEGDLPYVPPVPEYEYRSWALALPALCGLLIVWNVGWRPRSRRKR